MVKGLKKHLPEGWEINLLEDLACRGSGHTPNKAFEKYYNGGIKWVSLADSYRLDKGYIFETDYEISELGLKNSSAVLHPAGTVLISRDAGVGKSAVMGFNMAVSQHFITWTCKRNLNNWYLYYWLQFYKEYFEKQAIGSTIKTIGLPLFKKLKIIHPPLPEQTRIAQLLSTWDCAIETTQKLIAQKELSKKWLMQMLLTGKSRLKGFSGEWSDYHLGELFIERNETNQTGLQLLSIGQNGVYPQSDSDKKDTSNEDKSKYKRICPGDIGYNTMRLWQGRCALSSMEGIVSPAYTIVIPKKNADSNYFSYLFKIPRMINLFWRKSQGLVDDTLNCKYKDFSIIKFRIPEKPEQTAIAQVLQTADAEIKILKTKLDKLKVPTFAAYEV
jgi:type I restriction enzyme S subunit